MVTHEAYSFPSVCVCLTCCLGAVAACCASCGYVFAVDPCWCDAEPLASASLKMVPAGPLFHWWQEVQHCHISAPENTRSSNDYGYGGAAA